MKSPVLPTRTFHPDMMRRVAEGHVATATSSSRRSCGRSRSRSSQSASRRKRPDSAGAPPPPEIAPRERRRIAQHWRHCGYGGDAAATDYFRKTTSDQLTQKFLPIVTKATAKVGLAEKYNNLAGQGAQLGLVDAKQARIEDYVMQKALDGLFLMIAEEEKAIRKDPVGSATGMATKVFGLLGK